MTTQRHISTVRQFCDRHPAFPEGGLRWQIFHAESNGLQASGAVLRNGRRVLIDEDRYFRWLDARNDVRDDTAA
jgi:hypothetical protein